MNAVDGYTNEYVTTLNEEFDRATELLQKATSAYTEEAALGPIIGMANHRLHLASLQMEHKKFEQRREEQHQRQITFTSAEDGKLTADITETCRTTPKSDETLAIEGKPFCVDKNKSLTKEELKRCNETIDAAKAAGDTDPLINRVYELGNPDCVYFVAGAVDVKVFFNDEARALVQAITFDGEGNGEMVLCGHPGDKYVDELTDKQGELHVVVWDQNQKRKLTAFRGIVRTFKPIWGCSIDDIVIDTKLKFKVVAETED